MQVLCLVLGGHCNSPSVTGRTRTPPPKAPTSRQLGCLLAKAGRTQAQLGSSGLTGVLVLEVCFNEKTSCFTEKSKGLDCYLVGSLDFNSWGNQGFAINPQKVTLLRRGQQQPREHDPFWRLPYPYLGLSFWRVSHPFWVF